MQLHEVAHARAGDKGDTSILTVIPFKDEDYDWLVQVLKANAVRTHLSDYVRGDVVRYELPKLRALQFVCSNALGGGVTTSLAVDTHGKGMSSRLLALEIGNSDSTHRQSAPTR